MYPIIKTLVTKVKTERRNVSEYIHTGASRVRKDDGIYWTTWMEQKHWKISLTKLT